MSTSSPTKKRLIPCPNCKQPAEFSPNNAFRPFCSERCKLIDLGLWASEQYTIAETSNTETLPEDTTHPLLN